MFREVDHLMFRTRLGEMIGRSVETDASKFTVLYICTCMSRYVIVFGIFMIIILVIGGQGVNLIEENSFKVTLNSV